MDYPQTSDQLTERVWQIMQRHKGYDRRIDRDTLTFAVYRKVSKSYDRKVRDALAELPVVWDGGYFIPVTDDEAKSYREQMKSRQAAIGKRLRVLDDWLHEQREPVKYEQVQLL